MKLTFPDVKPQCSDVASSSETSIMLWFMWEDIFLTEGVLYRKSFTEDGSRELHQLLLPTCLRKEFVQTVHTGMTGGHLGVARTRSQLRSLAF